MPIDDCLLMLFDYAPAADAMLLPMLCHDAALMLLLRH